MNNDIDGVKPKSWMRRAVDAHELLAGNAEGRVLDGARMNLGA